MASIICQYTLLSHDFLIGKGHGIDPSARAMSGGQMHSTPKRGRRGHGSRGQGQDEGQEVIHAMMGPDGQIFLPEGHGTKMMCSHIHYN